MRTEPHLPYEKFVDPLSITEILSSREFMDGEWRKEAQIQHRFDGVSRFVLPFKGHDPAITVLVDVEPNTKVPLHVHKGDAVCRYILSGSLFLNGTKYESGEWVIVPKDKPYEIATDEGYRAVLIYCGSTVCK
jgi:redox-sensitive bicupin YhaK (pirin superfamily)